MRQTKMETKHTGICGMQQKQLRRKFIAINTYKKQARNIPNKQPNSTLYGTRKRRTEPNISRRKEITEIRSEINEIEKRKTIENVTQTKS